MAVTLFHHIDNAVERVKKPLFMYSFLTVHVLYALLILGIVVVDATYMEHIHVALQVALCLFLIFRFNPLRSYVLKDYDGEIIFSSALFLLYNLGITEFLKSYFYTATVVKL